MVDRRRPGKLCLRIPSASVNFSSENIDTFPSTAQDYWLLNTPYGLHKATCIWFRVDRPDPDILVVLNAPGPEGTTLDIYVVQHNGGAPVTHPLLGPEDITAVQGLWEFFRDPVVKRIMALINSPIILQQVDHDDDDTWVSRHRLSPTIPALTLLRRSLYILQGTWPLAPA